MVKQKNLTMGVSSSVELTISDEIDLIDNTIIIQNHSSTNNVYVGNKDVSTTNYGILVYPESIFSVDVGSFDKLYGISNANGTTVSVLILDKA